MLHKLISARIEEQKTSVAEAVNALVNAATLIDTTVKLNGRTSSGCIYVVHDAQTLASAVAKLNELQDLLTVLLNNGTIERKRLETTDVPSLKPDPDYEQF